MRRPITLLILGFLLAAPLAAQTVVPGYYLIKGSSGNYVSGVGRTLGLSATASVNEQWQYTGAYFQSFDGMTMLIASRKLALQPQMNAAEAQTTAAALPDGKVTIAKMVTAEDGYFLTDYGTAVSAPLASTLTIADNMQWSIAPISPVAGRKPLQKAISLTLGTASGWFGLRPVDLTKFVSVAGGHPAGGYTVVLSGVTPAFTLIAAQRVASAIAYSPVADNVYQAFPITYLFPIYIKTASGYLSLAPDGSARVGSGSSMWFFCDPNGLYGPADRVAYDSTVMVRSGSSGPYLTWDPLKDPVVSSPANTSSAQRWVAIGVQ